MLEFTKTLDNVPLSYLNTHMYSIDLFSNEPEELFPVLVVDSTAQSAIVEKASAFGWRMI